MYLGEMLSLCSPLNMDLSMFSYFSFSFEAKFTNIALGVLSPVTCEPRSSLGRKLMVVDAQAACLG